MESFEQILKVLNDLKLNQQSIDWIEDIPDHLYEKYLKGRKYVAENLDVETHRWYELSTEVWNLDGRFMGVRKISNIFSEEMDVSDVYHTLEFFEMKEVTTITYVPK